MTALGINLYFSNLGWDSPGHLPQEITKLRANRTIGETIPLSPENAAWNHRHIQYLKRKVAFLSLRYLFKTKGNLPQEIRQLAREDKTFYQWFPISLLEAGVGRALGLYHPR